ncbi:DUF2617 domain-containing protein [Actinomadura craniellae]|uniref:DUF2617 domain-containing protein n=1 Tax=Actinomadura craniellae TaxID=2231787 RepID=A0A365H869_9ACTN|nr:DUF2617 family protein [Actinomadura craniellae]RAY14463.1 DUF2617 domain-containing protein [Actinomadura craniellae]
MLTTLRTAYADTRADALSFALGLPPLDALAVLPLECAGHPVELRLLGASHQVIVGPVSETVACLPDRPGPLPTQVRETLDGWSYAFTATVRTYGAAGFGPAVDALCARLAGRDDALTGTFPGSPHAVTALAVDPGPAARRLGWQTWHAYPQTREIVMTQSRLVSEP